MLFYSIQHSQSSFCVTFTGCPSERSSSKNQPVAKKYPKQSNRMICKKTKQLVHILDLTMK